MLRPYHLDLQKCKCKQQQSTQHSLQRVSDKKNQSIPPQRNNQPKRNILLPTPHPIRPCLIPSHRHTNAFQNPANEKWRVFNIRKTEIHERTKPIRRVKNVPTPSSNPFSSYKPFNRPINKPAPLLDCYWCVGLNCIRRYRGLAFINSSGYEE
jgi:hypothetical protein